MKSNDIELTSTNPFGYEIGQKVMGFDYNRGRHFICGTIIEKDHSGHRREENAYKIKSEYGDEHSGTLFENGILPSFDRNILFKELRKDKMLTIRVSFSFGVHVIVEKDGKEIFSQRIDDEEEKGNDVEPGSLLESYQKLLICLGFKPLSGEMYMGDGLLVLKFSEPEDDKNTDRISKHVLDDIRGDIWDTDKVPKEKQDEIINSLTPNELFDKWCAWNGYIGLKDEIKRTVFEIYGIKK